MSTPPKTYHKPDVSPSLAWLRNSSARNTKKYKTYTSPRAKRSLGKSFRKRRFGSHKIPGSVGSRRSNPTLTPYSDTNSTTKSTYFPTPALNIEQRKTMLVDRMEHRVCLVSKNNDKDVLQVFRQQYDNVHWLLNIDQHIVARRVNWSEK